MTLNLQGAGLLGVGDLTGISTCLSPTMGCNARSALAYATDANTQVAAGFVIKTSKFAPAQWNGIKHALADPSFKVSFDEESWELTLRAGSQKPQVIPLPKQAVVRRVYRVGKLTPFGSGIGLEPFYGDPSNESYKQLSSEVDGFIRGVAQDMGTSLDQPTTIRESRIHGGTYTDSQHGFAEGDFVMEPAVASPSR